MKHLDYQPHIPFMPISMACAGAVLLGFSPIFVRVSDLGPMTTGFYRMLVALPLLWTWMSWEEHHTRRQEATVCTFKDHMTMFLAGLFFALDLGLWNWSVNHTAIVNATLFNNTAAFFVPLLMWVLFKEKQPTRFIIAAASGFLGCILLAGESFTISIENLVGDIVALLSGILVALYVVAIKKIRERILTGMLMFWTSLTTLLGMGLLGLLFRESFWPLTYDDLISIFGLAVLVHLAGQGLLAYAMGKIPASYGALIMLLSPVTAAVLGWIIYGEHLSVLKSIGIIIIMASIVAVRQKREKSTS